MVHGSNMQNFSYKTCMLVMDKVVAVVVYFNKHDIVGIITIKIDYDQSHLHVTTARKLANIST